MTEIKIYKSRKKVLKLFLLATPLIMIGIWMIIRADSSEMQRILGWIGTCFFGLAILVGLFHLFDKRPQIIINEIGIYDRTTNYTMYKLGNNTRRISNKHLWTTLYLPFSPGKFQTFQKKRGILSKSR